ncbi:MAG: 50S ribosomal protein L10 [Chitinophagaceae bacterium]
MNKEQKKEVIEALKDKFTQYSNFYITNTESLSVAQITNLRRHCFNKQVEMKVAKNTLIKKALESFNDEKYSGIYDSLHQVTALMFSESPKEPALILSSFRKALNAEKPLLKAAFLNGDIFVGDNQLLNLTKIKTKNELIGEVIGLLMSPIQRVIGALQNREEKAGDTEPSAVNANAASSEAKSPEPAPEAAKPESVKASSKVETAEASKAENSEAHKDETKETPKAEVTEVTKAETKETPKAEATEVTEDETKETPKAKAEATEAPKADSAETSKKENIKPAADSSESKPESEAK